MRFSYARKGGEVVLKLRGAGAETVLPVTEGAAFADDPNDAFRVVSVRVGDADKGQVVTQNAPLAIAAIFD